MTRGGIIAFVSSLRWRLSLILSAFVLICAAVCVIAAVIFLGQALTVRSSTDLQRTLNGVSGYMDNQRSSLLGIAEMVSSDPIVARDVHNRHVLITHLTRLYADLDTDILDVVDRNGRVVVRMEDTLTFGDLGTRVPGVRGALAGNEAFGLERDPGDSPAAGGFAVRATVPIRTSAGIIGAVVVGRRLDSVFASHLSRALDASINLVAGKQRTGTTLVDADGLPATGIPESRAVLDRIDTGRMSTATTSQHGQAVLSGIVPLKSVDNQIVGAVEVVRPLKPVYDVIRDLSLLLIVLGLLVVSVGTISALYVGRRLTQRLFKLERRASQVVTRVRAEAPLGDLRRALDVRGSDEVASLSQSFDAMMEALDERLETNASLYAAALSRVNELTGLAEVARLLTAAQPVEETLDALSTHVSRLVGCAAVAIYIPGGGRVPSLHGGCGLPDGYAGLISNIMTTRTDASSPLASHAAFWTGRPAWRSMDVQGQAFDDVFVRARAQGWGAATSIPLRLQDRPIGVLTCYTEEDAPLSDSDLSLLTTIADQVAVAVENARLYAQAHDVAAGEERARLARDLHDSVTQALFSMTMQTRAAQMLLEREGVSSNSRIGHSLQELGELTQGALAEMRALIFELRPDALREEGLIAALRKQSAAVSARESIRVDVEAPGDRLVLEPLVEEHLYRVALEAVHNVVKHARASSIRILIKGPTESDAAVTLQVIDDGVGFDISADRPGHLGLGTMADRIHAIGGTLEIASSPTNGTTVCASIPIAMRHREDVAAG